MSAQTKGTWIVLDDLIRQNGYTVEGSLHFMGAKDLHTANANSLKLKHSTDEINSSRIHLSNGTVENIYETKSQLISYLIGSYIGQITSLELTVESKEIMLDKEVLKSLLGFIVKHNDLHEVRFSSGTEDFLLNDKLELVQEISSLLRERDSKHFNYLLVESDKSSAYNRTKLIFVGKGGAGKTSCLRALLGQPFVEEHLSTDVANGHNNVSMMDFKDVILNSVWKDVKVNDNQGLFLRDYQNMSKAIVKEIEVDFDRQKTETKASKKKIFKKQRDFTKVKDFSKLLRGSATHSQKGRKKKNNKRGNGITKLVKKVFKHNKAPAENFLNEEESMKLVLWDFGGQDVAVHHLYFTNQGLVLLVFDLQNWINNREEEELHIENWLNSLMYYAKNSHVFIAGTRAESPEVKNVGLASISKEIDKLLLKYDRVVVIESDDLCFFPVENSSSSNENYLLPLRQAIKETLETPVTGDAIWKKKIPLAWLFFMHVVEQQGDTVTSLQKLHEFGRDKGFAEEEIKSMLDFFTTAGTIVSFRAKFDKLSSNKDLVLDTVIRPKWLIKTLSSFLFDVIHTGNAKKIRQISNMKIWIQLHRQGIMAKSLFENILKYEECDNDEIAFLTHLCEVMMVMSKVRSEDVTKLFDVKQRFKEKEEHFWLLPSMNVELTPASEINMIKYSEVSQIIQIQWENGIPQGCFERFTCSFLNHCNGREGLEFTSLTKNLASFVFGKLKVAIEKESGRIFNVIMQSKDKVAVVAMKEVLDNVLEDLVNLDLVVKLKAEVFIIRAPKPDGSCTLVTFEKYKNCEDEKPGWDFDCFLSHNWGKHPTFATHEQVISIGKELERQGFKVAIAKNQLKDCDEIHKGVDGSSAFIAFINRRYLLSGNNRDKNPGKEFCYATKNKVKNIVPVLLDKDFVDPDEWKGNVGYHLGNALYIDFTTPANIKENFHLLCERIKDLSQRERPVHQ